MVPRLHAFWPTAAQLSIKQPRKYPTSTEAAEMVEMKQPDVSKLLRGRFKLVSVEKLMRMLTAFDQDVEITVKPNRKRGEAGRITFIPAA
jgi:predicted XRE-type DNA-binding protein